eukprot:5021670-Prymnesium_polylepis.1
MRRLRLGIAIPRASSLSIAASNAGDERLYGFGWLSSIVTVPFNALTSTVVGGGVSAENSLASSPTHGLRRSSSRNLA